MNQNKHTNKLIDESSPYLQQHAHNPVNWVAWSDEIFEKAQKENKLVLISIGYSSCHWCHVMEHESFEDEKVAQIMNEHFICIKVDREERPDVDQIYMNAVQLMTGQGGWPLNCFTLPDGKPIYGGTYFPKTQWLELLDKLNETYDSNPDKVKEYANKLTEGIQTSDLISVKENIKPFSADRLHEMVNKWKLNFDTFRGGPNRAPKFPLPNNYEFLMQYAHHFNNQEVMEHVDLTLEKMAYGGIYDQIGGGFARYSTDTDWKVPHFEKMLYDNAQLVSLYSKAYQRTKNPLYKHHVYQTLDWVKNEMTTNDGAFYSALDADSEGEEGKFYVWEEDELKAILGEDFEIAKAYYNINRRGVWEGKYILLRYEDDSKIANQLNLSLEALQEKIQNINAKLLAQRSKRIRPGLDDKSLTSWNCMMTIGYVAAYSVFDEDAFLKAIDKNVKWFEKYQLQKSGKLYRTYKNQKSKIDGFLDDYAYAINMYINIYELSFDETYLNKAKSITDYTIEHFEDSSTGMFFYTSDVGSDLIARKMEISDNVIPSSNSIMAQNLWKLGTLFDNEDYKDKAKQMLSNVYNQIQNYGSAYSNWGQLVLNLVEPYYEIAITGKEWKKQQIKINDHYLPNSIFMGGTNGSLPLLKGKFTDETSIYVCVNKTCKMPVQGVDEALKQIK